MDFTHERIVRYARQLILPEIGGAGQARLAAARVLVVGAGGLGSPVLLYLAGAGVGTLGIADHDRVELSNLHRQIVHAEARIGMAKTDSAAVGVRTLDTAARTRLHAVEVDRGNAEALVRDYDLVADGSDNFPTRDAIQAACLTAGVPLVSAAFVGLSGTLTTFKAHLGAPHPCFRCLYPSEPPAGLVPTCAEAGVLGPAVGTLGGLQAVEVLKELLGLQPSLSGTLLLYDALTPELRRIALPRRPDCPVCGGDR